MSSQSKTNASLQNALESLLVLGDSQISESKTHAFCQTYKRLPKLQRLEILKQLSAHYNFDILNVQRAAESYLSLKDKGLGMQLKAGERLKSALNPAYARILARIGKVDGGVKFLVDLRADLLNVLPTLDYNDSTTDHLKSLNNYLKDILSASFNVGFLALERVTWDSSCDMLEKISMYEAVHPVRNWTDLKHRVGPYRRCYVFTHSSMPNEPIVVLHTALTNEISSNIASIMKQIEPQSENNLGISSNSVVEDPKQIQAAVFYSITSTQKGLHGIELGNQLIKKVVREIQREFPHVTKLSSLSPIPGFREWLLMEVKKMKNEGSVISDFFSIRDLCDMKEAFSIENSTDLWSSVSRSIASNKWVNDPKLVQCLKIPLLMACAHYLSNEKRRSNALNSVAHFHLRNGAVMWRLNWAADLSPRGLDNSCGIMVNYRYCIDESEANSKKYIEDHHIVLSDEVRALLKPALSKSSL